MAIHDIKTKSNSTHKIYQRASTLDSMKNCPSKNPASSADILSLLDRPLLTKFIRTFSNSFPCKLLHMNSAQTDAMRALEIHHYIKSGLHLSVSIAKMEV